MERRRKTSEGIQDPRSNSMVNSWVFSNITWIGGYRSQQSGNDGVYRKEKKKKTPRKPALYTHRDKKE